MRNATPIQPQIIDNFHLLLIHAGSKIRLSRHHQYHYESLLSLFWKIFEEKGVSLSTDEWHIFLDCLFEFLTSKNDLKNSDITESENQAFLLCCAKTYALLSQEYLHLYSKKLTIHFLFSAAVAFAKNERQQTESNLLQRLPTIRGFLIDLICLTINEETLCHLTESLIYNDDLCDEEALGSYYEKLIRLKDLGFDLNQLLTFDNHTKKTSLVADEINAQLLQPLKFLFKKTEESITPSLVETELTREMRNTRPLTEEASPTPQTPIFAHEKIDSPTIITESPLLIALVATIKNIESAMEKSITAAGDQAKKIALIRFKVGFESAKKETITDIKEFLRKFALSAAKPTPSRFNEASFGNTDSMKKFFLGLSLDNQRLLKEALPDYDICYKPGLLGRNGKLSFTKKPGSECVVSLEAH